MRPPAAELVVGDDLFGAGAQDAHARLPIGRVGGDAQLQHRIAIARVLAMLQHEHLRAALSDRLVKEAHTPAEIVHHLIQAFDDILRCHGLSPCLVFYAFLWAPSRATAASVSRIKAIIRNAVLR